MKTALPVSAIHVGVFAMASRFSVRRSGLKVMALAMSLGGSAITTACASKDALAPLLPPPLTVASTRTMLLLSSPCTST